MCGAERARLGRAGAGVTDSALGPGPPPAPPRRTPRRLAPRPRAGTGRQLGGRGVSGRAARVRGGKAGSAGRRGPRAGSRLQLAPSQSGRTPWCPLGERVTRAVAEAWQMKTLFRKGCRRERGRSGGEWGTSCCLPPWGPTGHRSRESGSFPAADLREKPGAALPAGAGLSLLPSTMLGNTVLKMTHQHLEFRVRKLNSCKEY